MKSPTALRISAQLVESKSGNIVWASGGKKSGEPPSGQEVTGRRSQSVLQRRRHDRASRRSRMPDTADAQAYELYLKAKYTFDRKQSTRGRHRARLHRQALHKEPGLLSARAGVVEILIHQGQFDQAQTEVVSALAEARSSGGCRNRLTCCASRLACMRASRCGTRPLSAPTRRSTCPGTG